MKRKVLRKFVMGGTQYEKGDIVETEKEVMESLISKGLVAKKALEKAKKDKQVKSAKNK